MFILIIIFTKRACLLIATKRKKFIVIIYSIHPTTPKLILYSAPNF